MDSKKKLKELLVNYFDIAGAINHADNTSEIEDMAELIEDMIVEEVDKRIGKQVPIKKDISIPKVDKPKLNFMKTLLKIMSRGKIPKHETHTSMENIFIDVGGMEFMNGGNTIWIHSPKGYTILRIKTKGKIIIDKCDQQGYSHCDIMVEDDIKICVNQDENETLESE